MADSDWKASLDARLRKSTERWHEQRRNEFLRALEERERAAEVMKPLWRTFEYLNRQLSMPREITLELRENGQEVLFRNSASGYERSITIRAEEEAFVVQDSRSGGEDLGPMRFDDPDRVIELVIDAIGQHLGLLAAADEVFSRPPRS